MLRKEVQLHLQTAMRIHFEKACRVFKETNSKLEEKVSALELKQAEIDQEKSTLQKQVRELKSANAVLEAKVTAQEKNVSELKSGKFAWKIMNFSVILKNCQEWVWERDIQFSIRNWKTGLQIFDLFTTRWRSFKKKHLRFCIPTCYERWFRRHTAVAFSLQRQIYPHWSKRQDECVRALHQSSYLKTEFRCLHQYHRQ